ncbi:MAG TPA: RluA family pseudouridine synthase [Planctomycetes bacterium]|nr:RluA family pseudouridine synthase [Planctomycetota bacterium]HIL38131.1 RluA family pseudouridine synthase [Planctomycetota bacterium]
MRIPVTPDQIGARLDRFLTVRVPQWSRSRLQALIKSGAVRVDDEVVQRPGSRLLEAQVVQFDLPELAPPTDPEGGAIVDLPLLYSDEHIALVDKPAGLLSHANDRSQRETVVTMAEDVLGPLAPTEDPRRRGVVHRLDRMTSGVMIIARTPQAMEGMQARFADREVQKTYYALVHHHPRFTSEMIDAPLETDPKHRQKMRVAEGGMGRPASTLTETLELFRGHALVAAYPHTGRTHQVRVHLTHIGHPIVGDPQYTQRGAIRDPIPKEAPLPRRQCLHAAKISFEHPVTGEPMIGESPLASDFSNLLDWMRTHMAFEG